MKRLEGKKIVITGGSRGIGAAIARVCASEGARVAITYTSRPEQAENVRASLAGDGHLVQELNISDEESVTRAFERILKEFGNLDGLVNNAGITRDNLLLRMKTSEFDDVIQTNLRGTFFCTRLVSKAMLRAKRGSIVHITSVIGQTGHGGQSNYAAAKAGIEAFSRSVALELASRSIRSNCIAPGFIQTEMTEQLTDAQRAQILSQVPMESMGTGDDVALACCYLLSDESRYVTGHTLSVNGGLFMN